MSPEPAARYRLLPSLRCARLGRHAYFYDAQTRGSPLVFVPTRRVPERAFSVVDTLQSANPENEPWPLERLREPFGDPEDKAALEVLVRRGYLEAVPATPARATPTGGAALAQGGETDPAARRRAFEEADLLHHFARPRLFGLPEEIDDDDVDVALVGLPFASLPMSSGAALAPAALRLITAQHHLWFDVHAHGVFSDLGVVDGLPEVLCKGVVLKDYGDLGGTGGVRTVGDLFETARRFVGDTLTPRRLPALFIGGDHATTFALVDALLRHEPDLFLIHVDAHHDLLYSERITFSHAAVISNLVGYSGLKGVVSLGVRGAADGRSTNLEKLIARPDEAGRVRLHPIAAVRRLLLEPQGLDAVLSRAQGTPCYLSLDLDVLAPEANGGQVSTPSAGGIEWWELIELVRQIGSRCRLVAADVVELNPLLGTARDADRSLLVTLLLYLIHLLSQARPDRRG